MKTITKILMLAFILTAFSCGNQNSEESLVKKRIIQNVETSSMGMIKNVNVSSVEKLNDSIYLGIYSFSNPLIDKEIRITKEFTFTKDFDKITNSEEKKFEMKSEGEWVETELGF
jgi:hypothetical protein